MITKDKSHLFCPLKSGINYLCEASSSKSKQEQTIDLEGKSLKKGTVTPQQRFTDIGCDKRVHKFIPKYLQKEGEILIEKGSST